MVCNPPDFIHKQEDGLRRMIVSREWTSRVPKLNTKDKRTVNIISTLIYNNAFWTGAASIILVFEPPVKVL